jgi:hypothetical protein
MTIEVEGPGGVTVEFPDGTAPAEIQRAMARQFGGPKSPPPAPAPRAAASQPPRTLNDLVADGIGAPRKRGILDGAPTAPVAGSGRSDFVGRIMQLADQVNRTYSGAAADAADAVTGLINRPVNSVLRATGVGYQLPTDTLGPQVAQPVGAVSQFSRQVAPYFFGTGAAARGVEAAVAPAAKAITGVARGRAAAQEAGVIARAMPRVATPIATGVVAGAPVDAAMSSKSDGNLSNLVQDTTGIQLPTARAPTDSAGVAALKDMAEGAVVGATLEKVIGYFTHGPRAKPGSPEAFDEAAQVEAAVADPIVRRQLEASGITPESSPMYRVFAERAQARQELEAARAADPHANAIPPRPMGPDETIDYRQGLRDADAEMQARAVLPADHPEFINPAALPTAGVEPTPVEASMRVTPDGQAFTADQAALVGQDLRKPSNLPVVVEPQARPMADAEVARAQRTMDAGRPNPIPEGETLHAPENRAPQTRDDVQGQREAGQAFDVADRQAARVGEGIRDTQTAGLPEGPKPERVLLDGDVPVKVVDEKGNGRVTVQRYDPHTGEVDPDGVAYETSLGKLSAKSYTAEPRRAQDFETRDNPARTSPELPREPTAPVVREPTQTYRAEGNATGGTADLQMKAGPPTVSPEVPPARPPAEASGGAAPIVGEAVASEKGPHGTLLRGYEDRWQDAVHELGRRGEGDAVGVLSHPAIADRIDVPYGQYDPASRKGFGLAKIEAEHPEVIPDLPERIARMQLEGRQGNNLVLATSDGRERAVVSTEVKTVDGVRQKTFLITAYERGAARPSDSIGRQVADGDPMHSTGRPDAAPVAPGGPHSSAASVQGTAENIGEKPPGTKLYSNPADPEAIKELLVDPAVRTIKKEIDGFKKDFEQVKSDVKGIAGGFDPKRAVDAAARTARKVWWTNTAAIRATADKYKDVPEVRQLADWVGTDPGRGRVVEQTYERAVQMRAMGTANRLSNMLTGLSDAEVTKVGDVLAGRSRALSVSKEATAAGRIRKLLDEQHDYLREAGVEVGYVKGYYPRVVDEDAVLKNADGFKTKAAEVYRKMGLSAEEATDAASDWYSRILGVSDGAYASGLPSARHTKGRTLPAEADKILADFYVKDPRVNLTAYLRQTSRAAEFARRFGANGEKAEELFNAMLKKGVDAKDVENIRHHFESATGQLYSTRPDAGAAALSWIQTAGVLRLLPRAVISSAVEGLSAGVRAHDVGAGFKAMTESYATIFGLRDHDDVHQAAELLGIVGDAMNDLVIGAQFGGEIGGQVQQKLLARFFKTTGLHQITEAQRVAAARVGQGMVRTLLQDLEGTKRVASAKRLLAELGMDEDGAKAVSAWLGKNGGTPPLGELTGTSREAKLYRTALQRFVDESIQNPTAADKPQWASHPFGRLSYGITSFMFSFTRNVLVRTARETQEGVFGKGYTLEDRARLLTPALALGVLTAAQAQTSELRDMVLNPKAREERSKGQQLVTNLSRAGAFGNADPFINIAMSARYNRDLTSTLTGPYLTAYLDSISKMTVGLIPKEWGGPNTPNTNNAEWQASKATYEMIASPLIAAAASYAPGGPCSASVTAPA